MYMFPVTSLTSQYVHSLGKNYSHTHAQWYRGHSRIFSDSPNYKYTTVLGGGVSTKVATTFGPTLGPQVEGTHLGLSPKTRGKGQGHVTDASACMLHYTS